MVPRQMRPPAGPVSSARSDTARKETTMSASLTTPELETTQQMENATIRPFRIDVPEADLVDLRQRIVAMRWPEQETVTDASQGVQLATTQALARYWATDYDWRNCEARLKALPQFVTEIDGLD